MYRQAPICKFQHADSFKLQKDVLGSENKGLLILIMHSTVGQIANYSLENSEKHPLSQSGATKIRRRHTQTSAEYALPLVYFFCLRFI